MQSAESHPIVGLRVDRTSYEEATSAVLRWAEARQSRYVCLAVVATVVEALDSEDYRMAVEAADLVTPDGMPLVWMLRLLGARSATRVYGPDLTLSILARAERENLPVGFYGSTPEVLDRLDAALRQRFPALRIAYRYSPPFRPLGRDEDDAQIQIINESGLRVLFVGLGGAKQDYWMAAHRGRVHAPMLGVGAAFDFLAGTKPQAPRWMQRSGLEWLFRLATEPRRLWKRYLRHNPRFAYLAITQIIRSRVT